MAGKVNTTFIAIVAGACVLGAGGLYTAWSIVNKSPAENAAIGDKLMADGKFDEAALAYSKAVNKSPNNVEYLRKWSKSLSSQTPSSIQAYSDRYRDLVKTEEKIVAVLRDDAPSYAKLLENIIMQARLGRGGAPAWNILAQQSEDAIKRFPEGSPNHNMLRRYRGIATLGKLSAGLEVSDADRKLGLADLEAALTANPQDDMAMSSWSDSRRYAITRLNQNNQQEEAQKLTTETRARLSAFVAENPGAIQSKLALLSLELNSMIEEARDKGTTQAQFNTLTMPKFDELFKALEGADLAKVDAMTAVTIIDIANTNKVPNAYDRSVALFDRLITARNQDSHMLLSRAQFQTKSGHPKQAADEYRQIIALPNRPVSFDGMMLFNIRDLASLALVDALLATGDGLQTKDERDAVLDLVKKARDDVRSRPNIDEHHKILVDAKIAIAQNDTAEARKLLGQYHQMTSYSNVEALTMSAMVLERQGLLGEAKQMLQRIHEKKVGSAKLYQRLAGIDIQLRQYPSALNWVEIALGIAPGDTELLKLREEIKKVTDGANSSDPLVRALYEAEQLVNATPPNINGGLAKLQTALPLCERDKQFEEIARIMARIGKREEAKLAVAAGLKKFPASENLLALDRALKVDNPIEEIAKGIDAGASDQITKHVQKYLLYVQAGKMDLAIAELEAAQKIDPNHPVVVAGLFELKLSKNDLVEAEKLANLASTKDLDKVGGRVYRGRLMLMQGKFKEAIIALEQATEMDQSNPISWRLLGEAYMDANESSKGLRALRRSLDIKPEDPQAIVSMLRALRMIDQLPEALQLARESLRFGISEPAFIDIWLELEFERGDKDLAIDRRKRILDEQPDNMANATALATIQLRDRRVADAAETIKRIEGKPGAKLQVSLLKAALRGANLDAAGCLADFKTITKDLKEDELKGASIYLNFSRLMSILGQPGIAVDVLELGRAYQERDTAAVDRVLGDTYFAMAKWSEARAAYERARESIKEDTERLLFKRIIECCMRENKPDDAQSLLDQAGGDKSKDPQVIMLLAQLAETKGDKGKARALLDKAVQLNPQSPIGFRQRAMFYMNDPAAIEDCIADLKQAVGLDPRDPQTRGMLVQMLVRKGDMSDALNTLKDGLALDPANASLREADVRLKLNLSMPRDAVASCDEAKKYSSNPRWPSLAGVIHQSVGDLKNAEAQFLEAWKSSHEAIYGKALADVCLNQTPPNLALAREVINDPAFYADSDPFSMLTRARLAVVEKRKNDAINDLRTALTLPWNPDPNDNKSSLKGVNLKVIGTGVLVMDECMRVFGKPEDTIAAVEAATPTGGWPEAFRMNISRVKLYTASLKPTALSELENLIETSVDAEIKIAACSLLGTAYYQDNKYEKALQYYQKGLSIDPRHPELLNNLAFVMGKGLSRHAEALPYAERAAEAEPNNVNILDTLGYLQFQVGDADKAEKTFERARAQTIDSMARFMPTLHLLEIKLKKNDREKAEQLFKEVEEMYRRDPRIKRANESEMERIRKLMPSTPQP